MPVMGEDFSVLIETATPGTYVVVADMNSYDAGGNQPETRYPTFDRVTPLVVLGTEENVFTVGGLFTPGDAGQLRMLALRISRATANIKVLYDGTNGFTQPVKVRSRRHAASAEQASIQTITFECVSDGVQTIAGTGPLM